MAITGHSRAFYLLPSITAIKVKTRNFLRNHKNKQKQNKIKHIHYCPNMTAYLNTSIVIISHVKLLLPYFFANMFIWRHLFILIIFFSFPFLSVWYMMAPNKIVSINTCTRPFLHVKRFLLPSKWRPEIFSEFRKNKILVRAHHMFSWILS